MKITAGIRGQEQVIQRVRNFTPLLRARITETVERLTIGLQRVVMDEKLSGQVLNVRSGRLRRSIGQAVQSDGASVTGIVSTALVYARIHEYGGEIQRVSKPGVVRLRTNAKGELLRNDWGGAIFAKKSHKRAREVGFASAYVTDDFGNSVGVGKGYTIKMPERSFLRSALRDQRDVILQDIRSAASGATK